MTEKGVDAFLCAEEEASQLVGELAKLKEEIQSYATARRALDDAAGGVSAAADKLHRLAVNLTEVVGTLRLIGTPELLRAQEAVATKISSLGTEVERTQKAVTTEVASIRAGITDKVSLLGTEVERAQKVVTAEVAFVRADIVAIRRLVLGATGVLLGGLLVVVALLFLAK